MASGGGGPTQTPCVLFFDNEISHCQDMNKYIKSPISTIVTGTNYDMNEGLYDPESMEIPTSINFSNGTQYLEYQKGIGNLYAQMFKEEKHISNGITIHHAIQIYNWIQINIKRAPRFVVFDWDRTLSVVEGLFIPSLDYLINTIGIDENTFVKHISHYILGGEWRMGMLQDMYQNIISSKTQVVILTNNPSALPERPERPIFLKIIQTIFPGFNDANLLCASGYTNKSSKFDEYLKSLHFKGGKKRRTKRRKNTKTRRNTKRRRHR